MEFSLVSTFSPTGDQPQAIEQLTEGLKRGLKHQVLLGVTGSGKTFTMANVIARVQKPTLVISHNKTLAAQLYQEFRDFFPNNAVSYFVSYYDYYQPEAYLPQTDTYIEKETDVNQEIDKLRLAATTALMTRQDVIVIASVSCIYNLGSPVEYGRSIIPLEVGQQWKRNELLSRFANLLYERNDNELARSSWRVRGDHIDLFPSYQDQPIRLKFANDKLVAMGVLDALNGRLLSTLEKTVIYPAKHYVTSQEVLKTAIAQIEQDLDDRVRQLKEQGKELLAHRLYQKTSYDIEMMQEIGYCNGIENYSRYLDGRQRGEPPYTLIDYFPRDFLTIIDESHITVPQIRGMYNGDRARKQTLIDFGFRLPSALDNRPLQFEEFNQKISQTVCVSATPSEYEISQALMESKLLGIPTLKGVVEQLIRPTGILDPGVTIKPTTGQIDDLIAQIEQRVGKKERVLVTTLTKRLAEELSTYLDQRGIKVHYLHSEILALDRTDILEDLRRGAVDVVVGINLLREGLDLPEVSLVTILDADKEGFLRSETSLIQTMGRAARHVNGQVVMYADTITGSMRRAIMEITRRRHIQSKYNKEHHLTPQSINKPIRDKLVEREEKGEREVVFDQAIERSLKRAGEGSLLADDRQKLIKFLKKQMRQAAKDLQFEQAAALRDKIRNLETRVSIDTRLIR